MSSDAVRREMMERAPGQGRYSVTEREQRWLLRHVPEGVVDPVEILDRYLRQSTLRLRRAQRGSEVIYKFGQKVRHDLRRPSLVQMTNMYLAESEFELLRQVEGAQLRKTRWHWPLDIGELSVDVFGGRLGGLVLAEIELAADADAVPPPPLAVAEVTEDDRFSGGRLAALTPSEAEEFMNLVAQLRGPEARA
jgi:CYTH domain-containing protein